MMRNNNITSKYQEKEVGAEMEIVKMSFVLFLYKSQNISSIRNLSSSQGVVRLLKDPRTETTEGGHL